MLERTHARHTKGSVTEKNAKYGTDGKRADFEIGVHPV